MHPWLLPWFSLVPCPTCVSSATARPWSWSWFDTSWRHCRLNNSMCMSMLKLQRFDAGKKLSKNWDDRFTLHLCLFCFFIRRQINVLFLVRWPIIWLLRPLEISACSACRRFFIIYSMCMFCGGRQYQCEMMSYCLPVSSLFSLEILHLWWQRKH